MKKLFLFIGILSMSFLNAQDINDALRYSQQNILGSARYRGMSGAFGALGGDISALQINPAGSAVFLNSFGSITISSRNINNDANYLGTLNNRNSSNLNFNQIGAIFVYNNYQDDDSSGINKISLGLTYDQTTDNANKLFTNGQSNTSIESFFRTEAQGLPLNLISRRAGESISGHYNYLGEQEGYAAQQAFLGREAFIIEERDSIPNNTSYISNIAPGNFDQEYFTESTGLNGKFTINGGMQINKGFYIGVNLNTHFINYDRVTEFYESNNNTGSIINEVIFTNKLSTTGAGLSAQIGGIAKISNMIRLGASLESPTVYYIEEETIQQLETYSRDRNETYFTDPDVINIFPEYRLRTPAKATGSIAFLFGKQGLISLDYAYKDYSTTKLSSDEGISFTNTNREIDRNLQGTSTVRIGTEWRHGNWSVRGGYVFEESPYKNELVMGDKTGFSLGTGFDFGKFKFDIAYDYSEQEYTESFYPNSGFSNFTSVDNYTENLTFTLGMNF
ncbi:OmpP1/FadL family transporter [Aquimarina sp. I32.4]|uniref:OmpP1/FadL family transporter n=1 Tax=Aquimarina sp. I32.4 TaxID=2053903 RepID=UPI000CDEE867|nr:transporter [Aquimarina sp. I32.4]